MRTLFTLIAGTAAIGTLVFSAATTQPCQAGDCASTSDSLTKCLECCGTENSGVCQRKCALTHD